MRSPSGRSSSSFLQIDLGDVDEPALVVKASFQEQAMPLGMEPAKGSRALEHEDPGGAQRPAGDLRHEVVRQPDQGVEDAAAERAEIFQPSVGAPAAPSAPGGVARLPPWGFMHSIPAILRQLSRREGTPLPLKG